jgi:hypothetical protein
MNALTEGPGLSAWVLAQERMAEADAARRAWLDRHSAHPDPDEVEAAPSCEVCGGGMDIIRRHWAGKTYLQHPKPGQRLCYACREAGWRNRGCVRCGGLTRTRDWSKARHHLNGWCSQCSADEHKRRKEEA